MLKLKLKLPGLSSTPLFGFRPVLISRSPQTYRFPSFSSNDAVTLGLSIRKRFRGSSRHVAKGRGLVIKIQTIAGHDLFSCTVGELGAASSLGDVSLDAWAAIDGMINVVRRTGHSSYYVEKGIGAIGKTPKDIGIRGDYSVNGGAFPIWLQNCLVCPIAIVAAYGGSSYDDHRVKQLVVTSIRDYLTKTYNFKADLTETQSPSTMGPSNGRRSMVR
ncbi:hypothetical protein A7U60_g1882 [Sanghuangporus baumii]|uniref:Uncharacterized protein n=1 Tax=Sanghuangporus baumii TaxID=108892 RepID=A0A9Q5NAY6_SANBA|nr:hypothetical protein A7U60_g1882 [Sanghuangporus baumii]